MRTLINFQSLESLGKGRLLNPYNASNHVRNGLSFSRCTTHIRGFAKKKADANEDDFITGIQDWTYDELEEMIRSNPDHTKKLNQQAEVYTHKRRWIDRLRVTAISGNGGSGCVSFLREKYKREGPPDGGNGGRGGSIFFEAKENASFIKLKQIYKAQDGVSGSGKACHGKNAEDTIVKVPLGTRVMEWHEETKEVGNVLADLDKDGMKFLGANGGTGGRGNKAFASGANRSPQNREEGQPGETKTFHLELRTIADIGLVGFPNAGKSTLLSVISNAVPKIASYAFTTLNPYVGMMEYPDFTQISVADLPGLIEGASQNIGLGHKFLRHIERTKLLCFVIDMGPSDRKPWDDFLVLRKELELYNRTLLDVPYIIVANKMDSEGSKSNLTKFKKKIDPEGKLKIVSVSAKEKLNIDDVKRELRNLLESVQKISIDEKQ